jgi:hypothetical protein
VTFAMLATESSMGEGFVYAFLKTRITNGIGEGLDTVIDDGLLVSQFLADNRYGHHVELPLLQVEHLYF